MVAEPVRIKEGRGADNYCKDGNDDQQFDQGKCTNTGRGMSSHKQTLWINNTMPDVANGFNSKILNAILLPGF